jgi:hypothetical protein
MTALLVAYIVFSGKLSLQIKYPWGQIGAYFAVFLALIAICTIFFQHLESMPLAIFGSAFFSAGAFVLGYLVLSPLERLSLRRCLIGIANLNRSAKA